MDDVRAAAERLHRFATRKLAYPEKLDQPTKTAMEDVFEVSKFVMNAAHPADDAEPIDDDWLESIGFSEHGLRGMTMLLAPRDGRSAISELCIAEDEFPKHQWSVSIAQGVPDDPRAVDDLVVLASMPDQLTRGDVRRLLSALVSPTVP